jgi:hypothetical protein
MHKQSAAFLWQLASFLAAVSGITTAITLNTSNLNLQLATYQLPQAKLATNAYPNCQKTCRLPQRMMHLEDEVAIKAMKVFHYISSELSGEQHLRQFTRRRWKCRSQQNILIYEKDTKCIRF